MELKPVFNDLDNPETFINHIQQLKVGTEANQNPFPVEVFPEAIQEIIISTNESLKFPIDFMGASILYAASVSIGNTHRIEVMKGWQETPVLYLAIVGRAGTNKTHPLTFALKPIEQRDNKKHQEYLIKKQEYDSIVTLSKKERDQQGYDEPIRPSWEQILVTDFTPEALVDIHKFNLRGIGVYNDELASWYKNFNRYNKGSEEQFWLSAWSGKPIRVNRKTSDPNYIPFPFISVIGTIQPGILNELADNRTENGFMDRLLFVIPDNLKKEYWSETELNPLITKSWENIISNLLNIPLERDIDNSSPKPVVLKFKPEARQLLTEWQKELTDLSNKPENEAISGIYAKVEMYAVRFALILQILRYACNIDNKNAIGIEAVQGALKLVEYFTKTAIKVFNIVTDASPLDKLPLDKQTFCLSLPDTFTTNEGLQIALNMEIPERTYKRFLNRKDLFKWIKQGEYERLY